MEHRLEFLRRFLPFERGIPSHDTLNDVINALEPALFKECFTNWVEALRERDGDIIAIDGKTSRRSHDRGSLHMVSAWATRQRLVLGQQACAEKGSVANFNHVKSGLIFRRTYAASFQIDVLELKRQKRADANATDEHECQQRLISLLHEVFSRHRKDHRANLLKGWSRAVFLTDIREGT